jgi:hypothetical protein
MMPPKPFGSPNDSDYGLSATAWTRDRDKAHRIARELDVGGANINDMFTDASCIPLPLAGWKDSGVGARLGGMDGLRKYCRVQAITDPWVAPRSELHWYPYSRSRGRLIVRVLRAFTARGLRRFWRRPESDQS